MMSSTSNGERHWSERVFLKELVFKEEKFSDEGFFYDVFSDLQKLAKDGNMGIYDDDRRAGTLLAIMTMIYELPVNIVADEFLKEDSPFRVVGIFLKFLDFSKFVSYDVRGNRSNKIIRYQTYVSGPSLLNELADTLKDRNDVFNFIVNHFEDPGLGIKRVQ